MNNIPLTSHHLIGYFLPGHTLLILSYFCYLDPESIQGFLQTLSKVITLEIGIGAIIVSFTLGIIIDAFRSLIDKLLDGIETFEIDWLFFNKEDGKKIQWFYSRYYNFYVFDWNFALVSILIILQAAYCNNLPKHLVWIIILFIVCCIDALFIRSYMSGITTGKNLKAEEKASPANTTKQPSTTQ